VKVAAITIENWKLPIFERHLKQAGYVFDPIKSPIQGMAVLTARHVNPASFRWVIKAAVVEAKNTGVPK
jgi:hypothetical protein